MRLTIVAKAKNKKEKVVQIATNSYAVSVKEPPIGGRANEAIIKSLAEYFSVPRSQIILVSGHTAKIKVVEVPDSLNNFEPLPKQKSLF